MQIPVYEHPVWQTAQQPGMRPGGLGLTEAALAHCDLRPGMRVLDAGCGTGATLGMLTSEYGLTGFGLDISRVLLAQARQTSRAGFLEAQGEQLPIAQGSLDAVTAECVLSIFDMPAALGEYARVLKAGGYLIASDLYVRNENGQAALRALPAGTALGSALPRAEIETRLAAQGLSVLVWQDCSEILKEFPICNLCSAAQIDPFDLAIAAAKARLGYYYLVARK